MNERHVNLLLIADDETNHDCFIKKFGRLVGSQYNEGSNKTDFCGFCLHRFSSHYTSKDKAQHRRTVEEMEEILKKYEERCFAFSAKRTEFPDDPILKFENIQKQVEASFIAHADFESILKQLSGDGNKCQEYIACSHAYQIVSSVPGVEFEPRLFVGIGAADHFLDTLQDEKDAGMIWNDEA